MNRNNNQVWKMIFLISQIGITMLTTVFMCLALGYLVDYIFKTRLMGWFIVLGVIAGIRSVYILIKRYVDEIK